MALTQRSVKLMVSFGDMLYHELEAEAVLRDVTVQELLRSIAYEWLRKETPEEVST